MGRYSKFSASPLTTLDGDDLSHEGNYKTPEGDLTGQRFGMFTVIGKARLQYIIECACGIQMTVNKCHVGRRDSCIRCFRRSLKSNKLKYTRNELQSSVNTDILK